MNKTNLFDIIKDILYTKKGNLNECFNFEQSLSSNYILQRWLSMESKESARIVNETTNKLWNGLDDDKELWYKLYTILINKKSYKKINYIKKSTKVVNEKRDKEIEEMAKKNQLSRREVVEYYNMIDKLEERA